MANFDSGVKGYIVGTATVHVYFPVDWKDNPDVSCKVCPYYSPNGRYCHLNHSMVEYPEKFVGSQCPLEREEYIDGEEEVSDGARNSC